MHECFISGDHIILGFNFIYTSMRYVRNSSFCIYTGASYPTLGVDCSSYCYLCTWYICSYHNEQQTKRFCFADALDRYMRYSSYFAGIVTYLAGKTLGHFIIRGLIWRKSYTLLLFKGWYDAISDIESPTFRPLAVTVCFVLHVHAIPIVQSGLERVNNGHFRCQHARTKVSSWNGGSWWDWTLVAPKGTFTKHANRALILRNQTHPPVGGRMRFVGGRKTFSPFGLTTYVDFGSTKKRHWVGEYHIYRIWMIIDSIVYYYTVERVTC